MSGPTKESKEQARLFVLRFPYIPPRADDELALMLDAARADERAKAEREIAESLREWGKSHVALSPEHWERRARAVERGAYRKEKP